VKRAAVFVVLCATVGCTRINSEKDNVLQALYRTESVTRTYDYAQDSGGSHVEVRGDIADDYRYTADASADGRSQAALVVDDDARAARGDATRNHWVVDPNGANTLFSNQQRVGFTGLDPMYDALTVLKYVRQATGEADFVTKFNPESQDYRPKFDPFPRPGPHEIRYDLLPPPLKPRDPTTSVGNASQLPGVRYFRRMSVYVRDGLVVGVREQISVENLLIDPRSHLAARAGDYNIDLGHGSVREQAARFLQTINAGAAALGLPPIREREMSATFTNFGSHLTVALPRDAQRGSLRDIFDYGQVLFERAG
jgi:hypothetical protein